MKCLGWLITIIALVACVLIFLIIQTIVRNRKKIRRWWRRNEMWKFVFNVLMPSLIPLAITVAVEIVDSKCSFIRIFVWCAATLSIVNFVFQLVLWIKEKRETEVKWKNKAAKYAFDDLFDVFANKGRLLVESYHHGLKQGMLCDAYIPYNVFAQIKRICLDFKNTIVNITGIGQPDMDVAFIYRYCYKGVTKKDAKWRWVIGKGAKFSVPLNDFTELSGSTFRYMMHNNCSALFYNDKQQALNDEKYLYSYRDHSHNRIGSICAAKIAFSGNDGRCCEGIIMINTYGHQFLEQLPNLTEQELSHLIFDDIFPCYRNLLEIELGMLYFRHETEPDEQEDDKKQVHSDLLSKKVEIKCVREINRVLWEKCENLDEK